MSFTLMGMHREPKRSQGSKPEVETRTFTCKRSPAAPSNNTNIGMLKCCWEFPQASQRGRALWGKAAGNARWEGKIPALDSSFHPSLRGLRSLPSFPGELCPFQLCPFQLCPLQLCHSPTHSKLHRVCTKQRLKANGRFNFNSFYEWFLSGHRQESPGHKSLPSLGSPFPELPSLGSKKV